MNTRMRKLGLSLLLPICLGYSPSTLSLYYWDVNYTGESQGNHFSRQGQIAVFLGQISNATTNQPNPLELFFYSGSPGASPESGAIWFMTNNAFLGSSSQIDLADVRLTPTAEGNGTCVVVEAVPSLSAVGANVFNAYSGLTADMYQIFSGYMYFCSLDGFQTINGEINIVGTGAIFHSNTQYSASVNGRFIGEQ